MRDLDHNVVTFFRVLRERPEDLEMACRLTPYARAEYQASGLDEDLDDLERARRLWTRVNQSFGKNSGHQTGFSVTCARTVSTASSQWSRIGRLRAVAERLQRVVFECCDAATLVERIGRHRRHRHVRRPPISGGDASGPRSTLPGRLSLRYGVARGP